MKMERRVIVSRQNNKQQIEEKKPGCLYLPLALAVAVVPLIAVAKRYNTGLTKYAWFSDALKSTVDVFLYYKAQVLIILAWVMAVCLIGAFLTKKDWSGRWKQLSAPEIYSVGIYLVLSLISAFFSSYGSVAFKGGYEQWEGFNVLLAYGVLLVYAYLIVDSEQVVKYIVYSIIGGSAVCGAIGAFQYLHLDFFRSSLGAWYMSLKMDKVLNFRFNFPEGQSYSTLYNPNYAGSYVALVMPVLLLAAFTQWGRINKTWHCLAVVSACLNFVFLIGSQSLTGVIGVAAAAVFALIFFFPRMKGAFGKKLWWAAGGCVAAVVAVVLVFPGGFDTAMNKLFHPNADSHTIASMVSTDEGVKITTIKDEVLYLTINNNSGYTVQDADHKPITLTKNSNDGGMMVKGSTTLQDMRFFQSAVNINNKVSVAVQVQSRYNYKSWYICVVNGKYKLYNAIGKLDDLVEIPSCGFENNQHFGDKRGYIWSRTIPLLKDYILIGSGPNTFTEVYPNNDYVGLNNMNYAGSTITKPHNMYLQTWVQTGLLSLIAYLALVFIYLIRSVRLYWRGSMESFTARVGAAIMISVFGYIVTGIANDSTVAVAPVFWGLLGVGLAVNRMVSKENESKIK